MFQAPKMQHTNTDAKTDTKTNLRPQANLSERRNLYIGSAPRRMVFTNSDT